VQQPHPTTKHRCTPRLWWGVIALTLLPAVATAKGATELKYKVVKSFSSLVERKGTNVLKWEVNSTDGLAWDGSGLWMSGCDTMLFAKVDTNGKLIDKFMLPGMVMADHLAWDGKYLWANLHSMPGDSGPPDGRLIQIDTKARKIIKTIEVPFRDAATMTPMGMAFDGTYLWSNDPKNGSFYRIDPKTGAGKDKPYWDSLTINGKKIGPCGISWDGHRCLWISDLNLDAFIQVDPKTGQAVSFLMGPNNPDPTKHGKFRPDHVKQLFTGMTTDGKGRVWIVDELEGNPLVYEIDVDWPTTGPCAHPVDDGQACKSGGEPYCYNTSVCHDDGGKQLCRTKCDRKKPSCSKGQVCWVTAKDGEVCLPKTTGGFAKTCTGNDACQSGLCVSAEGQTDKICSESCTGDSDCAKDYVCGSSGGKAVCVPKVDPPADEGGCALAGRPAATSGLLILLLGAWLLLRARRRRP
jgi:hypothetical protein